MEKPEMRRKDRQTTEEKAREIIEKSEYAMLITASSDAVPYGVAVSHALDGDNIYFHCATKGRKVDNIKANPHVCMSFVAKAKVDQPNFTVQYESAVAEGEAVIIEDKEEKVKALKKICEVYCPEVLEKHEQRIMAGVNGTCVCKLQIKKLNGKSSEPNAR